MQTFVTKKRLDVTALEAELSDPSCGGVVTFAGRVRNHHEGRRVIQLDYEAYIPMAEKKLAQIATEVVQKFGVSDVRIVHRVGSLTIGDTAVWIGVQSPHRAEAFAACQYAIDEVKHRTPIWKKEYYDDSTSNWVQCNHVRNNISNCITNSPQPPLRLRGGSRGSYAVMHHHAKQAVILAGGASRRFGSDKIWAQIDGVPLIKILIHTLQQCGFTVTLSGPHEKLQALGLQVIADERPLEGPLAALATIFKNVHAEKILLTACDMPLISAAVIDHLWHTGGEADVVVLEGTNGPSPLPGVYDRATQDKIGQLLSTGRYDLKSLWTTGLLVKTVHKKIMTALDENEKSLCNINRPGDLAGLTLP